MRLEQKRGPFRIIDIFFEDVDEKEISALKQRYARINVLTHAPQEQLEGFSHKQKSTPNIHLEHSLESVFKQFRDTVRNEVNRTTRLEGFEIKLPDPNDAEAYNTYRQFEFAQGRSPITKIEFQSFILASAYWQNNFLSGITFFQSDKVLRVRSIFSKRLDSKTETDKELYKIIGFASKRLIFELCKYGIDHGANIVDLASINLTDPDKEPIARFKSGFGAIIEQEYHYHWSSPLFQWFEKLAAMRATCRAWFGRIVSRAK